MGARSLLRSSLSALALIAATAAFPSASHAITFNLTDCTGGCGSPPFGSVTPTQNGTTVDIDLFGTNAFVKTGSADFQAFKFNATGVVVGDITVDQNNPGETLAPQTAAFQVVVPPLGQRCNGGCIASTDYFTQAITTTPFNSTFDTKLIPIFAFSLGPNNIIATDGNGVFFAGFTTLLVLSEGVALGNASLGFGTLQAVAGPTVINNTPGVNGGNIGFGAGATARFGDTLFFKNENASSTTITTIPFSVHVDGILESATGIRSPSSGEPGASFFVVLGNGIRFQDFNPTAGNVLQNGSASGDWQLFGGTDTSRIIDEDVAGSFSFLGLAAYVPIFAQLSVPGQRGLADFEDTVAFSFPSLPDGVSFTSASVFFLPVPQPFPASSSVLSWRAWSWLAAVFSRWHDAAGALLEQSERASRRWLTLLQERAVGERVTPAIWRRSKF
jgi:hypothetical protein